MSADAAAEIPRKGRPSGDGDPPMPIAITAWRRIDKGPVIGSVDLVLGKSLEIYGCLVMRSNGACWVAFPGKPRIGADDKVARDDRGKAQYSVVLKWGDRLSGDRFSHAVLNAIAAKYGDAP
jgi:hypothetical protein